MGQHLRQERFCGQAPESPGGTSILVKLRRCAGTTVWRVYQGGNGVPAMGSQKDRCGVIAGDGKNIRA